MTIQTIVPVTVQGGAAPITDNKFDYIDDADLKSSAHYWLAGVRDGWEPSAEVQLNKISLVTTDGPPGGSGKSMMYTQPDRIADTPSYPPTKGYCGDYTIGRNWRYATNKNEMWVEIQMKVSPNFVCLVPYCLQNGISSPGLKTVFPGLLQNPNIGRFSTIIDDNFSSMGFDTEGMAQGSTWKGANDSPRIHTGWSTLRTLGWFTLRWHLRPCRTINLPPSPFETGQCQNGSTKTNIIIKAGGGAGVTAGKILTIAHPTLGITGPTVVGITGSGGATPTITTKFPTTLPFTPDASCTYYLSTMPCFGDGFAGIEIVELSQRLTLDKIIQQDIATSANIFSYTQTQTIYGHALGRNMNQGPINQSQTLQWGRLRSWTSDPGWGW